MNKGMTQRGAPEFGTQSTVYSRPLLVDVVLLCCVTGMLLQLFMPVQVILPPAIGLLLLVTAWRFPKQSLLILLLVLLFQPVALLVMKFLQMPDSWVAAVSALKELAMAVVFFSLLRNKKPRLILPDFLLLGLLLIALVLALFGESSSAVMGLKDDFGFILAYGAGRVLITNEMQQLFCVRVALAVIALIAILGILEFAFVGPAPRMFLTGLTSKEQLSPTFSAELLERFRAASTLTSPIEFGHICTIALLFFAAYRNWLAWPYWIASILIACGLLTSVTRSAWLGTAIGLGLIALRTGQRLKLLLALIVGVTILFALAPFVGMSDFLQVTLKGKESSLVGHEQSLTEMSRRVLSHPLGNGPGTAGVRAAERASHMSVPIAESCYLHLGIEYGVLGTLLFATFCISVIKCTLRNRSTFGVASSAVALAFVTIYAFVAPPIDFPGAAWTWLPIGFTVSCEQNSDPVEREVV